MNRAKLLALLAGLAYSGEADLSKIKAWLAATNTDLVDEAGKAVDIDAAWAAKNTVKVGSDGTPDGAIGGGDMDALRRQIKALEEKVRLGHGNPKLASAEHGDAVKSLAPKDRKWAGVASRKAYDAKAARGQTVYPDSDIADVCGAFARLALAHACNVGTYSQKEMDKEILQKAQVEYDDTLGGALVPTEHSSYFSDIKDRFSRIRQWVRVERMSRDEQSFPRRATGTTVYAIGEGVAITASQMTVGQVSVTAKKLGQLVQMSNELGADNAYNFAERLSREMAYQFAKFEERMILVGDGTSTYAGAIGFTQALKGLSSTIGNIAGLYVGSGNLYSELTLTDFEGVLGRFPDLEGGTGSPAWVCHRRFFYEVMLKLSLAAGGVQASEIINGVRTPMFLGYPVLFSNAMPRTEANSQVCCLFGDGTLSAVIGDRQEVRIDQSEHRYFDQDLVAFRGIQRVGTRVYEVGNAHATEASREPGPVVGLITAAA